MCVYVCRSVVNKLSKFQCFFCITESWLSSSIYDQEILHSNYVLYRNDRVSRGGGVLIAVHNSIPSSLVCTPSDFEIVSMKISSSNLIYIPPNCSESYLLSVIHYLSELVCSYDKCIIVGDFNLPDICWSSLTCTTTSSSHFCDFIFDHNLTQHILVPMHYMGHTLDLVITSPTMNISDLSVAHPVQSISSDHMIIITFALLCNVPHHI